MHSCVPQNRECQCDAWDSLWIESWCTDIGLIQTHSYCGLFIAGLCSSGSMLVFLNTDGLDRYWTLWICHLIDSAGDCFFILLPLSPCLLWNLWHLSNTIAPLLPTSSEEQLCCRRDVNSWASSSSSLVVSAAKKKSSSLSHCHYPPSSYDYSCLGVFSLKMISWLVAKARKEKAEKHFGYDHFISEEKRCLLIGVNNFRCVFGGWPYLHLFVQKDISHLPGSVGEPQIGTDEQHYHLGLHHRAGGTVSWSLCLFVREEQVRIKPNHLFDRRNIMADQLNC